MKKKHNNHEETYKPAHVNINHMTLIDAKCDDTSDSERRAPQDERNIQVTNDKIILENNEHTLSDSPKKLSKPDEKI